jgi:hypothetical protein
MPVREVKMNHIHIQINTKTNMLQLSKHVREMNFKAHSYSNQHQDQHASTFKTRT